MSSDSLNISSLSGPHQGKNALAPEGVNPELMVVETLTIGDVDVLGPGVDASNETTKAILLRFKGTLIDETSETYELLLDPENAQILALGVANVLDQGAQRTGS